MLLAGKHVVRPPPAGSFRDCRWPCTAAWCPLGQEDLPGSLTRTRWSADAAVGTVIRMIPEVDNALRSLIEREATNGTEVEVMFEAPTKDWASRRNVPTIDVYLYDIREDLRRRERGLINEYDSTDRITTRHLPPRHFKLSYLVTAWTQRPEDEHRLLSALLSCFLRHDAIPPEFITGPLAEMGLPVPVTVALPPPEDRSFADVWSALGGELKPSLDIVVSAPTDTGQRYAAGPPVTSPGRISLGGVGQWPPREARQARDRPAAHGHAGSGHKGRGAGGPSEGDRSGHERSGHALSGAEGSGRNSGSEARAALAAPAGAAGIVRGMSWRELAATAGASTESVATTAATTIAGTTIAGTSISAIAGDQAPGDQAPGGDDPSPPRKTKPAARRRRSGGIGQQ